MIDMIRGREWGEKMKRLNNTLGFRNVKVVTIPLSQEHQYQR